MSKLQLFYQNYCIADDRHKLIIARIQKLGYVQSACNHTPLSEEERERFFSCLNSILFKKDTFGTSRFFCEHLSIQFEQLAQFTLQHLIYIIECQDDVFSYECEQDYQFEDEYLGDSGNYDIYEQAASIEQVDVKETKRFLIESLKNIENQLNELQMEEKVLALKKRKLLLELSNEIMPNTELLLTIDNSLDEDLMAVKDFREHRNYRNSRGFLWINLDDFMELIKSVGDEQWKEIMGKITKLSILHHSGREIEKHGCDYSSHMSAIGEKLPYVSSVVLRGCGMAEEKRAKDFAEKEQKKCANHNNTSDFKWLKREKEETTRQHTLDIENLASGMMAASSLAASIITNLRASNIGAKVGNVSIKLYVGPYKPDAEHGAEGSLGVNDRYKRAPKALRFFIKKEEAKSYIPKQLDMYDELKPTSFRLSSLVFSSH